MVSSGVLVLAVGTGAVVIVVAVAVVLVVLFVTASMRGRQKRRVQLRDGTRRDTEDDNRKAGR